MSPAQRDKPCTSSKTTPPEKRDSPKSRYSALQSLSPKLSSTPSPSLGCFSSSSSIRRASDTTGASDTIGSVPRSSSLSPAVKSPSLAPKPLPLPSAKSPSPSPVTKQLPDIRSPLPTTKPPPVPTTNQSPAPTTRPEWIAPPERYSPTQIPTPKFVVSKRKNWTLVPETRTRDGSEGVGLTTPTTARVVINKDASTPKTASPLFQELDVEEADGSTFNPIIIITTAARCKNVSPMPRASGDFSAERKGTQGLGSRFEGLDSSGACRSVSSMMSLVNVATLSSSNSVVADAEDKTGDEGKRDSLSPTHNPETAVTQAIKPMSRVIGPGTYLSTSSPSCSSLLLSPSFAHPYTSGIHILPSCTSGSLTHRLTCGHLILTPNKPEICARNCAVARPTFKSARLKAQGFGVNFRGLDGVWMCPCCVGEENGDDGHGNGTGDGGKGKERKEKEKKCVGVLRREMLG